MYDSDDVIYAARKLQPHLRDMLGMSTSTNIERDIGSLLERADGGEKVDNLILERLTQEDPIREWLKTALAVDNSRELIKGLGNSLPMEGSTLPGNVNSIPTLDYVCPRKGCHFRWHLRVIGKPVPLCPVHKIKLKPVGEEE